jgi:transposase InsO family protein
MVQLDNGKEFENWEFIKVLKEVGCEIHFVTVGHDRSHGNIERFYSTLIEHIQLIQEERNLSIEEAAVRATLAYNHSIHRGTGLRPFEVFHGDEECRRRAKDATSKVKRERGRNRENKYANNISPKLGVGDIVFKKKFYKRLKCRPL